MRYMPTVSLLAAVLIGCGGSEGPISAPDSGSVSLFEASYELNSRRNAFVILFEGGLVYMFYQTETLLSGHLRYAYDGFFKGVTTDSGPRQRYQGKSSDFAAGVESSANLQMTFSRDGTSAGGPLVPEIAGDHVEHVLYGYGSVSTAPTTPARVGEYSGYARSASRSSSGWSGSVCPSGRINLRAAGCLATGRIEARPFANIHVADISMQGEECPGTNGTYTGHGIRSFSTAQLFLFLTDGNGNQLVFFQLGEPEDFD